MRFLLDACYLAIAIVTSPVWLIRMAVKGKLRTDWAARFGRVQGIHPKSRRRILIHGVSVGEINAARLLIERLAARDDCEIVVSSTTDTGFARARSLFGDRLAVVRYPFDLSFVVSRFMRAVQPDVVALMELEVWPNFTSRCRVLGIPVCVVNGRLTERSARRYARIRALVRPMFRRVAFAAVQTEDYAARFRALGMSAERVHITGTMKWDTAQIADEVPGAEQLREEMGIDPSKPLIVAGSTAPEEHALVRDATPEGVQLLCAPRKPEWFDDAARDLPSCARRSKKDRGSATGRFLLDTIGELRMAYALADLVVIGRSFVPLYGSDMMEPIALGKATIVGPNVADFEDTVKHLLRGDGLVQIPPDELKSTIHRLLEDSNRRKQLAENGRRIIRENQGATERHVRMILELLAE